MEQLEVQHLQEMLKTYLNSFMRQLTFVGLDKVLDVAATEPELVSPADGGKPAKSFNELPGQCYPIGNNVTRTSDIESMKTKWTFKVCLNIPWKNPAEVTQAQAKKTADRAEDAWLNIYSEARSAFIVEIAQYYLAHPSSDVIGVCIEPNKDLTNGSADIIGYYLINDRGNVYPQAAKVAINNKAGLFVVLQFVYEVREY